MSFIGYSIGLADWMATERAKREAGPRPAPIPLHLRVTERAECDWTDGNYECSCAHCGIHYVGPKRSVCCKTCAPKLNGL